MLRQFARKAYVTEFARKIKGIVMFRFKCLHVSSTAFVSQIKLLKERMVLSLFLWYSSVTERFIGVLSTTNTMCIVFHCVTRMRTQQLKVKPLSTAVHLKMLLKESEAKNLLLYVCYLWGSKTKLPNECVESAKYSCPFSVPVLPVLC